jgi:hypothetical protein
VGGLLDGLDGAIDQLWQRGWSPADLVPVLWVNSESETDRGTSRSQPGPYYRYWEVAGAMHGDIRQAAYTLAMIGRDQGNLPPGATYDPQQWEQYGERDPGGNCPSNYFPSRWAVNAAVIAIDQWVGEGTEPPVLAPYERNEQGQLVRDEHGNVKGGLRLPPIDVPVATYIGNECGIVGKMEQFPPDKLAALYPTHETYVAKMQEATDARSRRCRPRNPS